MKLVGRRFTHRHYLDPGKVEHVPALCQVTAERQGRVYYGFVVNDEVRGRIWRLREQFLSDSVLAWVN